MFIQTFLFELRYRIGRPANYAYFLIFLLMAFGATASDHVIIGEVTGNTFRNSPLVIFRIIAIMSAFGVLIASAMLSTPVIRDFEHQTFHVLYTYPMSKAGYLSGRFFGSYLITILIFLSLPLGILLGTSIAPLFGWIEPNRFDTFRLLSYLNPILILLIPNILFAGAFFFMLATLSRKMIFAYFGNIIFIVLYVIGINLLGNIDNRFLASLLDPFGIIPLGNLTRYWTVSDINLLQIPLSNELLLNRVIWTSMGLFFLWITYRKFSFVNILESSKKTNQNDKEEEAEVPQHGFKISLPVFTDLLNYKHLLMLGWLHFRSILRQIPFWGISFAGMVLLVVNAFSMDQMFGTPIHPVTFQLLEMSSGSFMIFILAIITFYSGELVWEERQVKMDQLYYSLPVPSWVQAGSKILGLFWVLILMQVFILAGSLFFQIFRGFTEFNLGLYFHELFYIQLFYYLFVVILAVFVQTLVKNKFIGHLVMILYYMCTIAFPMLGLSHKLFLFGSTPSANYSDMNHYGHLLTAVNWYNLMWSLVSVVFIIMTIKLWPRYYENRLGKRILRSIQGIKKKDKYELMLLFIAILGTIWVIIYNTTVLNRYAPQRQREKEAALFEKKYKMYEHFSQPRVMDVKLNVDLFPKERNLIIHGKFLLKNRETSTIDTLLVNLNPDLKLTKMRVGFLSQIVYNDALYGIYKIKLNKPLNPGDTATMEFETEFLPRGFDNANSVTSVLNNGTFIGSDYFPSLGYPKSMELTDKNLRKKYKLPLLEHMPEPDDSAGLMNTYVSTDGDWITFEATVSTDSNQIVLAPGYLIREWKEKGRKYFHYKMDHKILNFYSVLSAHYEVARQKWQDIDLEIYYQKGHEFNLDKMFLAMKASLEYYSKNFSPFPNKQLRIVEFPRYNTFAQSFPTMIPYSENIGFIADLRDTADIDYVYYVTAHEIAHQWWAHLVIGGFVKGSTLMSESFSQYSALMVMEKKYGKDQMKKFLKYELDRYLSGRRTEQEYENPLKTVENQGYVYYRKGSLVMYALRHYIGEDTLNKVLASYIQKTAYQKPPFTNSIEFIDLLRKHVPDSLQYLVTDLFETITLYSNRTLEAVTEKMPGGKYKVKLNFTSEKFRSDSLGNETPLAMNDWIDVGVYTKDSVTHQKKLEYFEKHKITQTQNHLEIIVDKVPVSAGIDPLNILIDRVSDDNVKNTKEQ